MSSRNFIVFYLNGQRLEVKGAEVFWNLSDFLRHRLGLTGTKVVCSEGDCGACTVLRCSLPPGASDISALNFVSFNSCIAPLFLLDLSVLVTVEGIGLATDKKLHPVQAAMVDCHGSQCGFCTPGFVMSLCALYERKSKISAKNVQNGLTGNLCRCTGYLPIIESALAAQKHMKNTPSLKKTFLDGAVIEDLQRYLNVPIEIADGEKNYFAPISLGTATELKGEHPGMRLFSSATDLAVMANKNKIAPKTLMSLHLIEELYELRVHQGELHVGAKITLSRLQEFVRDLIPEFYEFLHLFASPQIKNVATLVGNLANASPIADTIPFLLGLNAKQLIRGHSQERILAVKDFFLGYKKIDLAAQEIIQKLIIPLPAPGATLKLYKISNRRDLDISTVNAAFYMEKKGKAVTTFRAAYGGVGPTVLRVPQTETLIKELGLNAESVQAAKKTLSAEIAPLSDLRAGAKYREKLAGNLLEKFYWDSGGL